MLKDMEDEEQHQELPKFMNICVQHSLALRPIPHPLSVSNFRITLHLL